MKICSFCFNDKAIRSYIETNGNVGICDYTGEKSKVVDIVDLTDFFESLVDSFVEKTDGIPLYDIIYNPIGMSLMTIMAVIYLRQFLKKSNRFSIQVLW